MHLFGCHPCISCWNRLFKRFRKMEFGGAEILTSSSTINSIIFLWRERMLLWPVGPKELAKKLLKSWRDLEPKSSRVHEMRKILKHVWISGNWTGLLVSMAVWQTWAPPRAVMRLLEKCPKYLVTPLTAWWTMSVSTFGNPRWTIIRQITTE